MASSGDLVAGSLFTAVINVDFLKLPMRRLELLQKLAVHHPGHVSVLGRCLDRSLCAAGVEPTNDEPRRSDPRKSEESDRNM